MRRAVWIWLPLEPQFALGSHSEPGLIWGGSADAFPDAVFPSGAPILSHRGNRSIPSTGAETRLDRDASHLHDSEPVDRRVQGIDYW